MFLIWHHTLCMKPAAAPLQINSFSHQLFHHISQQLASSSVKLENYHHSRKKKIRSSIHTRVRRTSNSSIIFLKTWHFRLIIALNELIHGVRLTVSALDRQFWWYRVQFYASIMISERAEDTWKSRLWLKRVSRKNVKAVDRLETCWPKSASFFIWVAKSAKVFICLNVVVFLEILNLFVV